MILLTNLFSMFKLPECVIWMLRDKQTGLIRAMSSRIDVNVNGHPFAAIDGKPIDYDKFEVICIQLLDHPELFVHLLKGADQDKDACFLWQIDLGRFTGNIKLIDKPLTPKRATPESAPCLFDKNVQIGKLDFAKPKEFGNEIEKTKSDKNVVDFYNRVYGGPVGKMW